MLRYADDIIVFGKDEAELKSAHTLIVSELLELGHTLPEPGQDLKTQFVSPKQPVEFLGVDILFKESANAYVSKIPRKVKAKILANIADEYSSDKAMERFANVGALSTSLSGVPAAYRNSYSHADDWSAFEPQIKRECGQAYYLLYEGLFGKAAISSLSAKQRGFLGIGELDFE